MLDRIHDLYDELERQRVMLSFKGELSPDLITVVLGLIERKLDRIEPDQKTRKRVFNVAMECMQNLYHHNGQLGAEGDTAENDFDRHGVVMIAQTSSGYSVLTGNLMASGDVARLKTHLDRINALGPEDLKEWYRSTLADGRYSSTGGGGLGMIDIARRSGAKLEYGFVPCEPDNAFFSLNVNVNI